MQALNTVHVKKSLFYVQLTPIYLNNKIIAFQLSIFPHSLKAIYA